MIVQASASKGTPTLHRAPGRVAKSLRVAPAEQAELLGCPPPLHCPKVAKLSVFGVGMKSHTSVASRLFQSLAAEGINVDLISTTEVRINVMVYVATARRPCAVPRIRQ